MHAEICKWYGGADSPVLFMIDDLANTWVDSNHNGTLDPGEDWGYFRNEENSSFAFLNEKILKAFPELKVTFFVPVGTRAGMLKDSLFPQTSKPINSDEESKRFYRSIHQHPKFELAYHGTTHGTPGARAADFVQEWAGFGSVEEAVGTIERGIEIYREAVGDSPRGGKYCGYISNDYSDESIAETGFTWWCRYWNRGVPEGAKGVGTGQDCDPRTNFDVKRFGRSKVLDIPSTVNGELLKGICKNDPSIKGAIKRLLRKPLVRWKLRQIDYLIKHRLVISVQEHMAPSRDDGKRQTPNIWDDLESLLGIFHYLKDKNVWYCTGSELADYVNLRDRVEMHFEDHDTFTLKHTALDAQRIISLKFRERGRLQILLPNRMSIGVKERVANLPLMRGKYTIIRC